MPVRSRIAPPMRIARVEVSPNDPAELLEGRGAGDAVDLCAHHRPVGVPYGLTRHRGRVGEEGEGAGQQRRVEDVHARTAEDLLAEDYGEGRREGDHPQRRGNREDHRDQQSRHEESLVDFVSAGLCEAELDGKAHDVRHADHRKHADQTVEEGLEAFESDLRAGPPAAEQEGGHQRQHDHDHRTLHVVAVADMRALAGGGVGYEKECFEGLERRCQEAQLTPFGEGGLHLVNQIT